jgi:putative membrane protein
MIPQQDTRQPTGETLFPERERTFLQTHGVIVAVWVWYLAGSLWFRLGVFSAVMPTLSSLSLFLVFSAAVWLIAVPAFGLSRGIGLSAVIAISGFVLELVGVSTGYPFGVYHYGEALLPKIFAVPLPIGAAWGGLSLLCWNLATALFTVRWQRVLATGAIAALFDGVMEQSVEKLGFWYWKHSSIPPQNYLSWFLFSALIGALLESSAPRPLPSHTPYSHQAHHLLAAQLLFFLLCLL